MHNPGLQDWKNINAITGDGALEFDELAKNKLNDGDFASFANYRSPGRSAGLSIPTEDHYLLDLRAGARILVSKIFFEESLISVWCYFTALISIHILRIIMFANRQIAGAGKAKLSMSN